MSLLLLTAAGYEAAVIAASLAVEGVHVVTDTASPAGALRDVAERCALVHPDPAFGPVLESLTTLRGRLPAETPIVLCTPSKSAEDRAALQALCGDSGDVIEPRGWSPLLVAERIAASLIASSAVHPNACGCLRGGAARMRSFYHELGEVAPFPDPVLIIGEMGSGKELVARELHRLRGAPGALLAVNCAELSPQLLESELFGHERGAFTGADKGREGLLRAAGQGIIFLDEIGEMPIALQAKLLRVIEYGEVRPVGSNKVSRMDARVVCGTNRDLEHEVERGGFRADLLWRISTITLRVPPLRERRPDIPLLAQHFLDEFNQESGGQRRFPPGAVDRLMGYSWPGNVRELRGVVRRAAMAAPPEGGLLRIPTLRGPAVSAPTAEHVVRFDPASDSWKAVEQRVRATYFRALLKSVGQDKPQAIARSGLSRSQFYEILKALGDPEA